MRTLAALFLLAVGLVSQAPAQTCTGLCQQQVSCPAGGTTSLTGTVFAPNGVDPLPNVLVYIPNAPVDAFTPGVSCPVVGQPPAGSPLVGTTTAVDGTFTLTNVPVGANIPLVIQTGRWRRQLVVPATAACSNTSFSTRFPRNQSEGDIPKIAIATGSADQVECVLRKVGIDDAEFTNAGGTGRINVFSGSFSPGARIDPSTLSEDKLMGDVSTLNSYDVLMLPCEGNQYTRSATQLANMIEFANAGGRVYSSHFSYAWMYQNPPFSGVANWDVKQNALPDGIATVDTSFADGQTLSQWLQLVGASTTPGQIAISTLKHDLDGVIPPTQSYLTLNDPAAGNPVMQFVFDTPVGATNNQCGRVLFNEYHVENPPSSPKDVAFPSECPSTPMNAQEKLLEFSLFELTSEGGVPTLTPTSQDFGSEPVGFSTAAKTFQWINNSSFPASVTTLAATGDFSVVSSNCGSVAAGASCVINVVFTPSAIGARSGALNVGSNASNLTATLTGTGVPDLSVSTTALPFGNLDVGATSSKTFTITNSASGPVGVPPLITTGDYAAASNCPGSLSASSSCTVTVTFKPAATGPRPGTVSVNSTSAAYAGFPITLSGNGVDFSLAMSPTSSQTVAGLSVNATATTSPIAGFAAAVTLTCATNTPASTCTPAAASILPSAPVTTQVVITTTSQYTVVGYGGLGGGALLSLLAGASGALLWFKRRSDAQFLRCGLLILLLTAAGLSITGCTGQSPARNAVYTTAGSYTYTLTATDGFLTHSATYTLKVTEK